MTTKKGEYYNTLNSIKGILYDNLGYQSYPNAEKAIMYLLYFLSDISYDIEDIKSMAKLAEEYLRLRKKLS